MGPNRDYSYLLHWQRRVARLRIPPLPKPAPPEMLTLTCSHDGRTFRVSPRVVPTPAYCGPRCAAAAGQLARRRVRAERGQS